MIWGRSSRRVAVVVAATLQVSALPASASSAGELTVTARPGSDGAGTSLASNRHGLSALIWRRYSAAGITTLQLAVRRPGGSWSTPQTIARRKASAGSLRFVQANVDDRGRIRATWAERELTGPRYSMVSRIRDRTTGHWSRPVALATEIAVGGIDMEYLGASVAVNAAGEGVVVWCRGGNSSNSTDLSNPGTVFARLFSPSSASAPEPIWTGQFCSAPTVQINPRGDALLSWFAQSVDLDNPPQLLARRPARGGWSQPMEVPELDADFRGRPWARLSPTGRIDLFDGGEASYYGRTGLWHARLDVAGRPIGTAEVPLPSLRQTRDGWVGRGLVQLAAATIDQHGDPVLVYAADGVALRGGGLGIGALWVASRSGTGPWRNVLLDDLAEVGDPGFDSDALSTPALAADAAGRLVATWSVSPAPDDCRTEVFQSTRQRRGGSWSRRALVAVPTGFCRQSQLAAFGGRASLLEWSATKTVEVRTLRAAIGPAEPPRVALRSRTWRQIRDAGAIEFTCRLPQPGYCHVSLVDALRQASTLDALEGFCRPASASARVARADGLGVLRFPLADGCYEGGRPPTLRRTSLRFPVKAVADVVGFRSSVRTSSVEIGIR